MHLVFRLSPLSIDRAREGFAAIAAVLLGRPVTFTERARQSLEDSNHPAVAFAAEWADGAAHYREQVACGVGNPRDGYGYDLRLEVTVERPSGTVRARLTDGNMDPRPSSFAVEIVGALPLELEPLRAALAALFGDDTDHSAEPYVAQANAIELEACGAHDLALRVAREGLSRSPKNAAGRRQLVKWLARHDRDPTG